MCIMETLFSYVPTLLDMDTIDNLLGDSLRMLVSTLSSILAAIILISIILPYFLVPVFFICIVYDHISRDLGGAAHYPTVTIGLPCSIEPAREN